MEDATFVWTDEANTDTLADRWIKDSIVIFNNFCLDLTMTAFLLFFYKDVFSGTAFFLSLLMCSLTKLLVQDHMLTFEKPPGFNWYFPGLYSLLVPFYDINDFYFSGHVATGTIFTIGLFRLVKAHPKRPFLKHAFLFWLFVKLPYIWVMMTVTRTHFVVDMLAGLTYAFVATIICEKLSYFTDVLICGLRATNR